MDNELSKPYLCDWFYVPVESVPSEISNELIIESENEDHEIEITEIYSTIQSSDNTTLMCIPRYCKYGLDLLRSNNFIDGRTDGLDISFNMKVEPRDEYQVEAINTMIACDHGICQAKTAFGKTYVAINVISKLKKKTLILVHKVALAKQWKEDILAYTDLDESDIEIISGPSKKFKLDKPITISTVQSFVAKNNACDWDLRNKIISSNFGITIYDEVHATAGPVNFGMSSRWFASKRIYGLSATPIRGDNYDKMIGWLVGDVIYKDSRAMLPVYLTCMTLNIMPDQKKLRYWQFRGQDFMHQYMLWFCSTDIYRSSITKLLVDLIKMGKKILAVGAYKTILDQVASDVNAELIKQGMPISDVIMVHGTSDKKLKDINNDSNSLVISTNKYFSDGLSIAWLDTLVYLTPPSSKSLVNIPQLVGRIVRNYKGKHYVTVYDVYNIGFNIEAGRYNKRFIKYKEFNYHIIDTNSNDSIVDEFETMVKSLEETIKL